MTDTEENDYSGCKTLVGKNFIVVDESGEPVSNADSILGKRVADLVGLAYDPNKRLLTLPGGMELHPRMSIECVMATIYGICKRDDMQTLVQFFCSQNIVMGDVGNGYSPSTKTLGIALECRAWNVLRGLCECLCKCNSKGLCALRCYRGGNVLLKHITPALRQYIVVDDVDSMKRVLEIIKFDLADMREFDWMSIDIMRKNQCMRLLDNQYRCMRKAGKRGLSLANATSNVTVWSINRELATYGSWCYDHPNDTRHFGINTDSRSGKKIMFLRFLNIMSSSWGKYRADMPAFFFRRDVDQQCEESSLRRTEIKKAISALLTQHTYYIDLCYERPYLGHPMLDTAKSRHWHTIAYMAMAGNKHYMCALYCLGLIPIVTQIIHEHLDGNRRTSAAKISCPFHRGVRLGGQDFWRMYSTGVCLSWMATASPVSSTPESIETFVVSDTTPRLYTTWRDELSRLCLHGGQRLFDIWIDNPCMLFDSNTRASALRCIRVVWQVLVMNHGQSSIALFPVAPEVVMEIFKSLWVIFLSSCTCGEESFKRGFCVF